MNGERRIYLLPASPLKSNSDSTLSILRAVIHTQLHQLPLQCVISNWTCIQSHMSAVVQYVKAAEW